LKGKALDVGCGMGDFIKFRPNTEGVDINNFLVDYCRSKGFKVYLINDDVMPVHSAEFNSVL
jgi:hypothetical protein